MNEEAPSGRLFVFEGPDGVGKSTIAQALTARLNSMSLDTTYQTFPGREPGSLGRHVYELHHDPERFGVMEINPTSLQVLHIAAHIDAVESFILPALRSGRTVVLDRFWWSTYVYGRTFGADVLALEAAIQAEHTYWGAVSPTAVFLISRKIMNSRGVPKFDKDLFRELSEGYAKLVEAQRQNHSIWQIANNGSVDEAVQTILSIVLQHQ